MAIRVMMASEIRLYREGLQRVLQEAEEITLVGIASSAEEALDQAARLAPAVIVLDMAMADSFSIAHRFVRSSRVVILGIPEIETDVVSCLRAGILGFVTRDGSSVDLLDAIRAAARGEIYCSPQIA